MFEVHGKELALLWSFYYILFIGTLKTQAVPKCNIRVRIQIFGRNVMNL